jgi:hypothetical protein
VRPENIVDRARHTVEELAAEYEKQGYDVLREPSPSDTPESLRPYQPDLLATKGAEKWVIEVKTRGLKRQEGFWAALAEKAAQAGWRFRIVIAEGAEDDLRSYEMPVAAEIEAALASPAKLAAQGQEAAALLLGWSLFEAAARRRLLHDDQDPGRAVTPVGLAKALVHFGHLDESELDRLRKIADLRNQVAHGLFKANVPPDTIELLATLTRRMLADEQAA